MTGHLDPVEEMITKRATTQASRPVGCDQIQAMMNEPFGTVKESQDSDLISHLVINLNFVNVIAIFTLSELFTTSLNLIL